MFGSQVLANVCDARHSPPLLVDGRLGRLGQPILDFSFEGSQAAAPADVEKEHVAIGVKT